MKEKNKKEEIITAGEELKFLIDHGIVSNSILDNNEELYRLKVVKLKRRVKNEGRN